MNIGSNMDFSVQKARLIDELKTRIEDQRVLAAISHVPRECFVPNPYEFGAYKNEPLPIGHNQTISQPLIIAMMTEALELKGTEKVLEIGTGSGYQAAILAELSKEVITTERIPALAESAKNVLDCLGYKNIRIVVTGNKLGFESEAPYAAIIVTAGAPRIPPSLLSQLAIGGKMVIPVGSRDIQELYVITKLKDRITTRSLGGCRFVPLIANEAWEG
jgi:protein-L-isoaspartate(D-aspartate) O-methyltransferase